VIAPNVDPSGVQDGTAAINAAITAVALYGGVVVLPPGVIKIGSLTAVSTTGSAPSGSTTLTPTSLTGIAIGMQIIDTTNPEYLHSGTYVTALNSPSAGEITLSAATNHAITTSDALAFETDLLPFPSGVSLVGAGMGLAQDTGTAWSGTSGTTLDYHGLGAAIIISAGSAFPGINAGTASSFQTQSTGGRFENFSVTGQNTSSNAARGMILGDILNTKITNVRIAHFNNGTPGTGGICQAI